MLVLLFLKSSRQLLSTKVSSFLINYSTTIHHDPSTIHPPSIQDPSTIHPRSIHDPSTIHPRSIHNPPRSTTIHPRNVLHHIYLLLLNILIQAGVLHNSSPPIWSSSLGLSGQTGEVSLSLPYLIKLCLQSWFIMVSLIFINFWQVQWLLLQEVWKGNC